MKMPEDIRETAHRLAYTWAMPDEDALEGCTLAIARALLHERELGEAKAAYAVLVERRRTETAREQPLSNTINRERKAGKSGNGQ